MKKELDHFYIDDSYGGNQDWFPDFMMHMGGCAAETACDSCIYLAREKGLTALYPFNAQELSRKDYVSFSREMKPFLHPRAGGVSKLEMYTEGFTGYMKKCGQEGLRMEEFGGSHSEDEAFEALKGQIDNGFLVPALVLRHKSPAMKEYFWHWFTLNGYEYDEGQGRRVKAVTYGQWEWLDFATFWDTGYEPKGGMILYRL